MPKNPMFSGMTQSPTFELLSQVLLIDTEQSTRSHLAITRYNSSLQYLALKSQRPE
jgi:hypothetical protein